MFKTNLQKLQAEIGIRETRKRQIAEHGYFTPEEVEIELAKIDKEIKHFKSKIDVLPLESSQQTVNQ